MAFHDQPDTPSSLETLLFRTLHAPVNHHAKHELWHSSIIDNQIGSSEDCKNRMILKYICKFVVLSLYELFELLVCLMCSNYKLNWRNSSNIVNNLIQENEEIKSIVIIPMNYHRIKAITNIL